MYSLTQLGFIAHYGVVYFWTSIQGMSRRLEPLPVSILIRYQINATNELQFNLNQNTVCFVCQDAFENVPYTVAVILSRLLVLKGKYHNLLFVYRWVHRAGECDRYGYLRNTNLLNWEKCPDNKVHGATMGPSGADRTQVGPMLAPWTLLSGWTWILLSYNKFPSPWVIYSNNKCVSTQDTPFCLIRHISINVSGEWLWYQQI